MTALITALLLLICVMAWLQLLDEPSFQQIARSGAQFIASALCMLIVWIGG